MDLSKPEPDGYCHYCDEGITKEFVLWLTLTRHDGTTEESGLAFCSKDCAEEWEANQ